MMDTSTMSPAELRALADRIEAEHCTGIAAVWCPVHGDCACPLVEHTTGPDPYGQRTFNEGDCPLHSASSSHAET